MKETYLCYLNGKFYGGGDLKYMRELFIDYVVNCKMYCKDEVEFKVIKHKQGEDIKALLNQQPQRPETSELRK